MDEKLVSYITTCEERNVPGYLFVVSGGMAVDGQITSAQKYFVEINRSQFPESNSQRMTQYRLFLEDVFVPLSREPSPIPFVHLLDVRIFVGSDKISIPGIRLSCDQISAWSFVLPGDGGAEIVSRLYPPR